MLWAKSFRCQQCHRIQDKWRPIANAEKMRWLLDGKCDSLFGLTGQICKCYYCGAYSELGSFHRIKDFPLFLSPAPAERKEHVKRGSPKWIPRYKKRDVYFIEGGPRVRCAICNIEIKLYEKEKCYVGRCPECRGGVCIWKKETFKPFRRKNASQR
jgi:hypothetical protein